MGSHQTEFGGRMMGGEKSGRLKVENHSDSDHLRARKKSFYEVGEEQLLLLKQGGN